MVIVKAVRERWIRRCGGASFNLWFVHGLYPYPLQYGGECLRTGAAVQITARHHSPGWPSRPDGRNSQSFSICSFFHWSCIFSWLYDYEVLLHCRCDPSNWSDNFINCLDHRYCKDQDKILTEEQLFEAIHRSNSHPEIVEKIFRCIVNVRLQRLFLPGSAII